MHTHGFNTLPIRRALPFSCPFLSEGVSSTQNFIHGL